MSNLDPSDTPTAGDAQTRMNALLDARREDRPHRPDPRAARGAQSRLRADRHAGSTTTSTATASEGSRCSPPGWTTSGGPCRCPSLLRDSVQVGRDFYLAPLVPARGARGRHDRRGRRARAGPALPPTRGPAGGGRRALRRAARPARPGRLVARPLPAPHREARPGAPEGSRGGARSQPAPDARSRRSCSSAPRRCARSSRTRSRTRLAKPLVGWTQAKSQRRTRRAAARR